MASASPFPLSRTLNELHSIRNNILFGTTMGMGCDARTSGSKIALHQYKRRKISQKNVSSSCEVHGEVEAPLPTLRSSGYYMEPCLKELAKRELMDSGFCSRVQDFTVGRFGYGRVKFLGDTDVRWLDLDQIIRFGRHEVVVYGDEGAKPEVGQGLNKAVEVTFVL